MMDTCTRCQWTSHYPLRDGLCNRCRAKELVRSTTTRLCGHCGQDRPRETAGDADRYACPSCGAISTWYCTRCGARVPGGILEIHGERICTSCHQVDLEHVLR